MKFTAKYYKPKRVRPYAQDKYAILDPNGIEIGILEPHVGHHLDEDVKAYSEILTKAPELLKRLIDALDDVELNDDDTELIVPMIAEADELFQLKK